MPGARATVHLCDCPCDRDGAGRPATSPPPAPRPPPRRPPPTTTATIATAPTRAPAAAATADEVVSTSRQHCTHKQEQLAMLRGYYPDIKVDYRRWSYPNSVFQMLRVKQRRLRGIDCQLLEMLLFAFWCLRALRRLTPETILRIGTLDP